MPVNIQMNSWREQTQFIRDKMCIYTLRERLVKELVLKTYYKSEQDLLQIGTALIIPK